MGGNASSMLETQQNKLGAMAHICCSDKNYELHDSGSLLVRHARKQKLTVRKWRKETNYDYCSSCSADDRRDDPGLIIPAEKRGIQLRRSLNAANNAPLSPRDWEADKQQISTDFSGAGAQESRQIQSKRPKSPWKLRPSTQDGAVKFQVCNTSFERPNPTATKTVEPPPGWTGWEANVLKKAVATAAREFRIKSPGYAESQVCDSVSDSVALFFSPPQGNDLKANTHKGSFPYIHNQMMMVC
jgi:hypothetical protein